MKVGDLVFCLFENLLGVVIEVFHGGTDHEWMYVMTSDGEVGEQEIDEVEKVA